MKVVYAARVARFDLYRAVAGLSRYLTKWDSECDRKLHRLMCYIKSSLHHHMVGWRGNSVEEMDLHCFADANIGTDAGKSTTGCR